MRRFSGVVIGTTTFLGSFLLFQIQPIVAKHLLPWFGGGPGVWTVCMLFFQMVLLAGYSYAHLLARALPLRRQPLVHLAVAGLALATLPVAPQPPDPGWTAESPTQHLLQILAPAAGLVAFVLSATGPLLQTWVTAGAAPLAVPYRLYALSNAGSLAALVSYPTLIEPWLTRRTQGLVWSAAFGAFVALLAASVWLTRQAASTGQTSAPTSSGAPAARPSASARARWLALPAVASALLLAVTNVLCQDTAVVPLLWVLPLSAYLLSFVLTFDSPRWYVRRVWLAAAVAAAGALVVLSLYDTDLPLLAQIGFYTGALLACCIVCHGEVYRLRPAPAHVTAFYLSIAAGGATGSVAVALLAPRLFDSYAELPIALALLVLGIWLLVAFGDAAPAWRRPWPRRASGLALLALGAAVTIAWRAADGDALAVTRSFHGILRVQERLEPDAPSPVRDLMHGTTLHGMQFTAPAQSGVPLGYYARTSGAGLVLSRAPRRAHLRLGMIGLGIGTLSAYAEPGDELRYYEINPDVVRLARGMFTFLSGTRAPVTIVPGDARVSLEREPPQQFDVLVVDAFSGDAIPTHLLTREAFRLYLRHLHDDGVIALHIANRHLDLAPVVLAAADAHGLRAVYVDGRSAGERHVTDWMLLARSDRPFDDPAIQLRARPTTRRRVPWTDEWTSLWPILK